MVSSWWVSDESLRRMERVKLLLTEMVPDDATALPNGSFMYGFINENRHMVESFLASRMPIETWEDGAFIVELLMTSYMAAEKKKKLKFPPEGIEDFVPSVEQRTWKSNSVTSSPE